MLGVARRVAPAMATEASLLLAFRYWFDAVSRSVPATRETELVVALLVLTGVAGTLVLGWFEPRPARALVLTVIGTVLVAHLVLAVAVVQSWAGMAIMLFVPGIALALTLGNLVGIALVAAGHLASGRSVDPR